MRYMFKVLTLGDSKLSLPMIKNGKLKHQFQDHEISRWEKTINVGTDQAVIEIDAVLSSTIDFDSIIPTSDGILYFLDPNDVQSFDLFEMIIEIIQKMGRSIPIILVFYTKKGLIYTPSNFLLEYIWENYLIEAFVFDSYSKNTFYEVLECLSEAMITGNIPINIETTWMRIPYFMDKINRLLKDERYEDAGNLAEILTNMKRKFEKQDYFINAEQAAWLYYKAGEYLKASVVIQGVSKYSEKFTRIYVENMIHQASRFYNMKRFYTAAEMFEKAYLYAKIELNDDELADNALKLAITTWIIATEFQNAFQLMEKLDFNEIRDMMKQLTPHIANAVDRLIEAKRYDIVKGHLYFIIDKFQRSGLFEEIKILGNKIAIVLKILIKQYIEEQNPDQANLTLEELFNIWETFSLEREDIDQIIRSIAILFLNKNQFSVVDKLINFVQSYTIQKEITELRQQAEEEYRKNLRDSAFTFFTNAISVLKGYVEKEINIFNQSNNEFYKRIEQLKKEQKMLEATSEFKKRAVWFKNVGHNEIATELLVQLLNLYLEGNIFLPFLQEMVNLRSEEREDYLKRSAGKIQNKMESLIQSEESLERIDQILENFRKLFLNHLLYDETKNMERLHVTFKISRAKKLLKASTGLKEIKNVEDLLKQADMIYQRLSEKEPLDYDEVLEEITSRYINYILEKLKEKRLIKEQGKDQKLEDVMLKEILQDLSETNRFNEKIKNSKSRSKFHKQIADIEGEISKDREAEKIEIEQIHIMVEKLSRLKQMAKEELLRLQDTLKIRQGLKRLHYQELLNDLDKKNYEKILIGYEERVNSLFSQRKMDLAEIDFAVITIILFLMKEKEKLVSLRKKYSKSRGFVSQVIDFIITLIDYPDQSLHLQAIKLFENLALFKEEKSILHLLVKPAVSIEDEQIPLDVEDTGRLNKVVVEKFIDKLRQKEYNLSKRKLMERKYWREALDNIRIQNYSEAANEYYNKIELLVHNNHDEYFPINLIMGTICLLKVGKFQEAKRKLEGTIVEVNLPQDIIQNLPEYKLCDFLFLALQSHDEEKSDLILEAFIDYLPLFPFERGLILDRVSPSKRTEIKTDIDTDTRKVTELTLLIKQQLSNLHLMSSGTKDTMEDSFRTRTALKRMVYRKVLGTLSAKDFQIASDEYFELSIKRTTKGDYTTASVLILLGALCLFKLSAEIHKIEEYLNNFIGKIGFAEKVIKETFAVKLLKLLIDAKSIANTGIYNDAWNLIQIIPVFEEEKILLEK
jgi:hypothetical protein